MSELLITAREALENSVRVAEGMAATGASATHVIELFRALAASLPAEPAALPEDMAILGAYQRERSDGHREWWSGGTWLYPGEEVVVRKAAPSPSNEEGK